jgi:hypothetical protein
MADLGALAANVEAAGPTDPAVEPCGCGSLPHRPSREEHA